MGELRTTIILEDRFSKQLKDVNKAIENTVRLMGTLGVVNVKGVQSQLNAQQKILASENATIRAKERTVQLGRKIAIENAHNVGLQTQHAIEVQRTEQALAKSIEAEQRLLTVKEKNVNAANKFVFNQQNIEKLEKQTVLERQKENVELAKSITQEQRKMTVEAQIKRNAEYHAQIMERQNLALQIQQARYEGIFGQLRLWGSRLRNILTMYYAIRSVVQGIGKGVALSDKMTMTDAKFNLVAGGDKKLAGDLKEKTFYAAQRSTTDYLEFGKAVGKLGILAGDKFKNQDSIVRFVELMNKSFQISGADTTERNAAMLQITQAIASNRLQGDEFRSILENAPMVMQSLTKSLGVGHDKLKKMAKEGQITADVLIKAMFDASGKIEEMYKQLPMTWERHWAKIKNVYVLAFEPIHKQLEKLFASEKFQAFVDGLCTAMIVLGNLGGKTLELLAIGVNKLISGFNWLKNSMNPIVVLMRSLIIATLTYFAVVKIIAIAKIIWDALIVSLNAAKTAMAAGLNPIGLICAAIVLLIALFYGAVAAVNHFADTSYSATALIAGYVAMLGASIYNTFVFIYNHIASVAEFFVNVWTNPIYSVKKLFVNLATNVLDLCISMTKGWDDTANNFAGFMIDAINLVIKAWNKFIGMLPETVVTKLGLSKGSMVSTERISNVANNLEKTKANLQKLVANKPEDYLEANKLEYKNYATVSKNWYNKTEHAIANMTEGLKKVTLNGNQVTADALNGVNDKLGDVGTNTGNTAKNTGETAKNTSSTEDYSYLRDWSYKAGMGGSIGYNIKIEQNNRNSVASNFDVKKIADMLMEEIIKGMTTQGEGVR